MRQLKISEGYAVVERPLILILYHAVCKLPGPRILVQCMDPYGTYLDNVRATTQGKK